MIVVVYLWPLSKEDINELEEKNKRQKKMYEIPSIEVQIMINKKKKKKKKIEHV